VPAPSRLRRRALCAREAEVPVLVALPVHGQSPLVPARRELERALRLPNMADAEMVGVLYQLGRTHEALGNTAQSVEFYERVLSVDIRFQDAARRSDALRRG